MKDKTATCPQAQDRSDFASMRGIAVASHVARALLCVTVRGIFQQEEHRHMQHLEHPSVSTWEARRQWFESVEEETRGMGSYIVSEQACALIAEVQAVFCAGAWAAVAILAMAVIDAQLREEYSGFTGNTKKLLTLAGGNSALQSLRRRRNSLVHVTPENPALTVDQQWINRDELETDARQAIVLMFKTFYLNPGL